MLFCVRLQTVKTYRKGDIIIRKGTIGTSVVRFRCFLASGLLLVVSNLDLRGGQP